jgi:hypothetical protein
MGKLELEEDGASDETEPRASAGWSLLLEQVLDGVAHQLSNRVAFLAGAAEIVGRDATVPPVLRALADEIPKLEETLRLLRLLTPFEHEGTEPAEIALLVNDAVALAQLHPAIKHVRLHSTIARSLQPVVVRPTAFTRRVLMALVAAADTEGKGTVQGTADASDAASPTVTISARDDAGEIVIEMTGARGVLGTLRAPTLGAARRSS